MDSLGINLGFLLVQIFNLLLLGGWIVLAIVALIRLNKQPFPREMHLLWSVVILVIPILGAVAFLLRKPDNELQN